MCQIAGAKDQHNTKEDCHETEHMQQHAWGYSGHQLRGNLRELERCTGKDAENACPNDKGFHKMR